MLKVCLKMAAPRIGNFSVAMKPIGSYRKHGFWTFGLRALFGRKLSFPLAGLHITVGSKRQPQRAGGCYFCEFSFGLHNMW